MGIIIKYILRSIREKKFRTFLIIFAVALSAALYFASTSLSDSLVEMYTDRLFQQTGNADIAIYPILKSPSYMISDAPVLRFKDKLEYIIKTARTSARYKTGIREYDTLSLLGINLDDYKTMNDLELVKELKGTSFESNSIIISQKTAQKYNLDIGDTMEIYINDIRRNVRVYGIAFPAGIFLDETREPGALISYNSLCSYLETDYKPTHIYLKVKQEEDIDALITQLSRVYPKYGVDRPFSEQAIKDNVSFIAMPLLFMTILVTFMSIFIIYSSFKVITLEKMPVIGTFRSIGASKKDIDLVLLAESLFYGIIGGIAACVLGIGILYIMTIYTTPADTKELVGIHISISPSRLIVTFILSVIICVISSIFPIFKVSKIPLKEIVLNNITSKKKSKVKKHIRGVILILLGFLLPQLAPKSLSVIFAAVASFCMLIGTINLLPKTVELISKGTAKFFVYIFGNIGMLALKNIKGNKSILNSISLITIGISILLMINNVSNNITTDVINFYEQTCVFDGEVWMNNMDKSTVRGLLRHDGIESVYPLYAAYSVESNELTDSFGIIESIQDESYTEFIHYQYVGDKKEMFDKIHDGRNLITTVIMKNRFNLEVGDKLTLKLPEGDRVYTIIGFINTFMWNGQYALASDIYLSKDIGSKYYNSCYINTTKDAREVIDSLNQRYKDRYFGGTTMEEMLQNNEDSNNQFMSMLTAFSVLALIIGIIGVINNLIISFIERKQSLAVLRSIGMSKNQIIKMLFIEAIYLGAIGGIAGIVGGILIMSIVPYILEAMRVPVNTHIFVNELWIYLAGAISITILSSTIPVRKSSKLNIIEAIKYE